MHCGDRPFIIVILCLSGVCLSHYPPSLWRRWLNMITIWSTGPLNHIYNSCQSFNSTAAIICNHHPAEAMKRWFLTLFPIDSPLAKWLGTEAPNTNPLCCHSCRFASLMDRMSHVMRKSVLPYTNNKGADQPAHLRSLIGAFVVHFLDSIIPLVSISKISRI